MRRLIVQFIGTIRVKSRCGELRWRWEPSCRRCLWQYAALLAYPSIWRRRTRTRADAVALVEFPVTTESAPAPLGVGSMFIVIRPSRLFAPGNQGLRLD